MEQIKELTKRLIANSFKELLLQMPFEKITIKTITDHANVIRPTFYNHFHDKYELVEWIVFDDVLSEVQNQIEQKQGREALIRLLRGFVDDRDYYCKAFEITGQNGFEETVHKRLSEIILELFGDDTTENKLAAKYYASGLITMIRFAVYEEGQELSCEEIIDMYVRINRQLFVQLENEP